MDEVPSEMRAEIEKLESEALKENLSSSSSARFTSRTIVKKNASVFKVKDTQDNGRIDRSLDELPPGIREAVKRVQKRIDAQTVVSRTVEWQIFFSSIAFQLSCHIR